MSGAPSSGKQSTGELKTARALNTVAMVGAGHALYTSTPKKWRAKLVPTGATRAAAKVKGVLPVMPAGSGRAARIAGASTAGGWLAFHGAEMAGDVMARRSINSQIRDAEKVGKSDVYGGSNLRTYSFLPENVMTTGIPSTRRNPVSPLDMVAAARLSAMGAASVSGRAQSRSSKRRLSNGFLVGLTGLRNFTVPLGRGSIYANEW